MQMQLRLSRALGSVTGRLSIGTPSCRSLVVAELVALLFGAIALTVAPQLTLDALAAAAVWARDAAQVSRPTAASAGLVLLGATVLGLRAVLTSGGRRAERAEVRDERLGGPRAGTRDLAA